MEASNRPDSRRLVPVHAEGDKVRVVGFLHQLRGGPGGKGLRARRRESRGPLCESASGVRVVLCGDAS